MKNQFVILIVCISIFAVLGCGIGDRVQKAVEGDSNSNKSVSDKATEEALREKTGVVECDELLDWVADQSKGNDDNFVTKGVKEYFVNKIRQSIKENIEKNQNDKTKMAKECKEIKQQIDAQKSKEESNK